MHTLNSFNVKVSRKELLGKLQANREKHVEDYKKAMIGYYIELEERLVDALHEVRDVDQRESFETCHLAMDRPQSHESVYNTAIGMLSMSQDDHIIVTSDQFRAWCEDEWGWKGRFDGTNALYHAKVAASMR